MDIDRPFHSSRNAVWEIQTTLLEGIQSLSQLQAVGDVLCQSDYNDVVEERTIAKLCGFPLCRNKLPPRQRKGKYKISLKEHRVYDLQETWLYCSSDCLIQSRTFADALPSEHRVMQEEKLVNALAALSVSGKGKDVENEKENYDENVGEKSDREEKNKKMGITAQHEKFSSQLVIHEGEKIEVFEYGGGPPNAIEGYIPQIQREGQRERQDQRSSSASPASNMSLGEKGTKKNKSCCKAETSKSESDFTSTLIVEEHSWTKNNKSSAKGGVSKSVSDFTSTVIVGEHSGTSKKKSSAKGGASKRESSITIGEPCAQVLSDSVISSSSFTGQLPEKADKKLGKDQDLLTVNKSEVTKLKSALKTQVNQWNRNVSWADLQKYDENGNVDNSEKSLTTVESTSQCNAFVKNAEIVENHRPDFSEEDVKAARLESAEAFAKALTEAADAVASGDVDAHEAVSKAGISILPGTDDKKPEQSQNGVSNSAQIRQIWPVMPSSADDESCEAQECWYDSPPEGFCLELSPFAKMWMALDRWITASSVAHIYGRDESDEDRFLTANGREYPHKIVYGGGLSSEIEKTLASWISRALPGVVKYLRLSTPISSLEQALAHFLRSMTLIDAIPAFRMKHWHVIVALFLDALCVHRIPSIGPQMLNKRPLMDKIIEAAEISYEEYETMKELLIPLGRHPKFSSQSGG